MHPDIETRKIPRTMLKPRKRPGLREPAGFQPFRGDPGRKENRMNRDSSGTLFKPGILEEMGAVYHQDWSADLLIGGRTQRIDRICNILKIHLVQALRKPRAQDARDQSSFSSCAVRFSSSRCKEPDWRVLDSALLQLSDLHRVPTAGGGMAGAADYPGA
jgi:hypothetical protein